MQVLKKMLRCLLKLLATMKHNFLFPFLALLYSAPGRVWDLFGSSSIGTSRFASRTPHFPGRGRRRLQRYRPHVDDGKWVMRHHRGRH